MYTYNLNIYGRKVYNFNPLGRTKKKAEQVGGDEENGGKRGE